MKHLGGIVFSFLYCALLALLPTIIYFVDKFLKGEPDEYMLDLAKTWGLSLGLVLFILWSAIAVSLQFGDCQ